MRGKTDSHVRGGSTEEVCRMIIEYTDTEVIFIWQGETSETWNIWQDQSRTSASWGVKPLQGGHQCACTVYTSTKEFT